MMIWLLAGAWAMLVSKKDVLFEFVNSRFSPLADTIMPVISHMGEAWFITITLLLLLGYNAYRNWWYIIAALLSNIIPSVITQSIKSAVGAPRPLKYFNEAAWIHTLPEWPRLMERSFPSGHTCGAFSLFCFLSLLLPNRYRGFGVLFFVLALSVAYSRMYLAAHFFEDVYAGSILGCAISLLIVVIMNSFSHLFFSRKHN